MKLFRNIAKTMLTVTVLSAMVACGEDEAVYEPSTPLTNAQVYFSNTVSGDATLSMQDTEYNVVICRANTQGEKEVKLVATGSELMKVPASVKFANGEATANVKGTFDPQEIGYDNPQTLNIALGDEADATPYGESVFTLNVMIPAPWTSLGMATLTDDIVGPVYGAPVTSYEVEIQENDLTPGLFRLVNPYTSAFPFNNPEDYDNSKDYYLEIHAEDPEAVWFGETPLGLAWGDGAMTTASIADYYVQNGKSPEEIKEAGLYGTYNKEEGEITFPAEAILISLANYKEGAWLITNTSGMFSVLLPGFVKADYSAEVRYTGIFTAVDQSVSAVANLTLGADATDVKAVVMTQADDAAAVADALAAGDLEGTAVQAGRIEVPFNGEELGSDKLQIVVAVIKDGAVKTVATSGFEYYGGGSNPWKSIGMGTYTESILCTAFNGLEPLTYDVEILEHSEQPGLYRVMNPYGDGVYPYAEGDCAPAGCYLEINACDPEGVYVPMQSLGFDWGYGEMFFESVGSAYLANYDMETLKEAEYMGKVIDGNIVLPTFYSELADGSMANYQGHFYFASDGPYPVCGEDGFRVTLPGAAVQAPAKVRSSFVKQLERNFIGKRFDPAKSKRMLKRMKEVAPMKF